ncbi:MULTISPECIES: VOC family protein [Rhizobium]|uniref:PhnB-like domain-containing protein n=1 Tax=Rhizobium tropici TaxID=398 RepID=A0A329Y5L5_RHITR|nr:MULTISPECIES: VOC family protein [Rhizobium]MBB3285499.1 putative 3-demethylubiquinone-9 3-methyltransferase (glyoxalase superfamily) [Rhizobium sp. BK252]MBB3400239.1 putative 3-demethylubiquinone-9 3-methyltransferase (glyoxalase superfamily) [Rhizobium sp. BK289]MBB3412818.1 putative 3-demethylubiquinone-9 3-methyltransferase (glyoxalase superfamily) [Rhizobium sp. BK284]MBB3480705.1 putative 3-demethylubiquinone-9 3-methyltransferase (glyoxalase superfamily) [Rhizobium sp. BK347]MDK4719
MKVRQHLWFRRDMESAIEFYATLIPNSATGWISNILTDNPNGPAGSVKFAGFTLGNRSFMGFEAGPLDRSEHCSSIIFECETKAEADRLRAALEKGSSKDSHSPVVDPWGVSWQFIVTSQSDGVEAAVISDKTSGTVPAKKKFAAA